MPFAEVLRERIHGTNMKRSIFFLVVAGLGLATTGTSVQADEQARSWDEIRTGRVEVPPVGAVDYEIAYSSVGYDHFEASVSVFWKDEGQRSQILFEGIHDKAPAKISAAGRQLCVSVEYCQRYQDQCQIWVALYSYDQEDKLFVWREEGQQMCPDASAVLPDVR